MTAERSPRARTVRSVVLPSEHGGWGLTIEPGLLGLLVEPSLPGLWLALAALGAFLARTPVELALVDRRRGRRLPRTRLAESVAAAEILAVVALIIATAAGADDSRWLLPLLASAPLVAVQLAYDLRSRRRRLVPELTGAVAIAAVAPAVVLADGGDGWLAIGLWLVLIGRVATSIPHVRWQIRRARSGADHPGIVHGADAAAVLAAGLAAIADVRLVAGAIAVVLLVGLQRWLRRRPVPRIVVVGVAQMALGALVVAITAIGVASG